VEISNMSDEDVAVFINVSHDMAIPAGLHQVTLSVTAFQVATQSRVQVGSYNMTFFRIDEARDDLDTSALVSLNEITILIDPGVDQEGVELIFELTEWSYYDLSIITWTGSSIVLETINVPPHAVIYLTSIGPGEVVIGDVTASWMSFMIVNASMEFQGILEGFITLWAESSDVIVNADIRVGPVMAVFEWGSNVTIEGTLVDTNEYMTFDVFESNLTINDCTFTTNEGPTSMALSVWENSSLRIVDCTFRSTSLFVAARDVNCTVEVKDCAFKDPGSYLMLLNYRHPGYYDERYQTSIVPREGEVSGNVFEGSGTGLVFHLESRNGYLGSNSFNNGAEALALLSFQVYFDDRTYGCFTYAVNATKAIGHELVNFFDEYYWEDLFRLLVDVTEDPLKGEIPEAVPVVIRITNHWYNSQGVVVKFDHFPLDDYQLTIDVPTWDYIHTDLRMLIPDLDDPGNWWKDS
jgi:hypothetical protein